METVTMVITTVIEGVIGVGEDIAVEVSEAEDIAAGVVEIIDIRAVE